MNESNSSEKCKIEQWNESDPSNVSPQLLFCCLFQMRRSTSTAAARRRMKKERWVNPGQCLFLRGDFFLIVNTFQTCVPSLVPCSAPSSTSPVSPHSDGTSCACSWPIRSARRRRGGNSWSNSRMKSTSACCWLRGRNALRSRRSREGDWRRLGGKQ